MDHNPHNRGYQLPPGCKDLIDVLKLEQRLAAVPPSKLEALPEFKGELSLPPTMSVRALAALIGVRPYRLIADLIGLGVMVTLDHALEFDTLSKIAARHGYRARPAA